VKATRASPNDSSEILDGRTRDIYKGIRDVYRWSRKSLIFL
jgi:hypothetical protein